ncbi:hypothetical protein WMY93_029416 [Mugilogobius chulae]|uniref:Uncharacterized protein n=1 Tax=Mugilogobius chulae TaxID=88201 RepID=A0AAW0MVS9_9GOBI
MTLPGTPPYLNKVNFAALGAVLKMERATTSKRPASSGLQTPPETSRKVKKRRILSSATKRAKNESDRRRSRTRVNLAAAFEKWRALRTALGIKRDPQLALFLIRRYEQSTVAPKGLVTSTPQTVVKATTMAADLPSSVSAGDSDGNNFDVAGVQPLAEEQLEVAEESIKSVGYSVDEDQANNLENSVIEFDGELASDPYDSDYVPPISLRAGDVIQKEVDKLPIIGIEEAVLDICDHDEPEEPEPEDYEDPLESDIPLFPKPNRVVDEGDLVNQQACIAYTKNLMQMASFLQLPISKCYYSNPISNAECDGRPPFTVQSHSRGNNFAKIALLFKFMNMRMVASTTHYRIQHFYCVPAIKDFWEEKRSAIISRLQLKDSVVALADGRMDSPGHSATYCSYTTMELETMDIISIVNIDKRQVGGKSVAMEKAAFIKTFDHLIEEIKIKEIVTDAHVQIAALMRKTCGGVYSTMLVACMNGPLADASMAFGRRWLKDVEKFLTFRFLAVTQCKNIVPSLSGQAQDAFI